MKILLFSKNGHDTLLETDVVAEAEKIIKEYEAQGMKAVVASGEDALSVLEKVEKRGVEKPEEIYMLYPMAGGC